LANLAVKEEKAINQIYEKLNNSINSKGYGSMIVCGGRSPVNLFNKLSHLELQWQKIKIILVDDRLVDSESQDSNESLLYKHLLCNNAIDAEYISLKNEASKVLSIADKFDIAILGFGDDGHFASLFPDYLNKDKYFSEKAAPNILKTKKMGSPHVERVTMNLSMILRSDQTYILASTQEKMDILDSAKTNASLPLFYLINNKNIVFDIVTS
tara:strand:- start:7 stop:642 length:636 start_codon:yes stop_codon:yes gene_type:complete